MNSKIPSPSMASGIGWLRFGLPVLALLLWGNAQAAYQDIDLNCPLPLCPGDNTNQKCYAAKVNTPINAMDKEIAVIGASGDVFWDLAAGAGCSGTFPNFVCAGINVTIPAPDPNTPVSQALKAEITHGPLPTPASSSFTLTVTASAGAPTCSQPYRLQVNSKGGGWGDPHITTVDGINYDFQSAGEFIALRGDGLEIQTRQTPVATASVVGPNAHTGLTTCVSIYSAVAARVGNHRVSYQPNFIEGIQDPSGLQLRVDGVLTTLGPEGIDLGSGDPDITSPTVVGSTAGAIAQPPSGGRIVKSPAGGGIEIHYADGTKLVVTPDYWDAQKKWYLNVNVYETVASEGIMGKLATRSWLPALPDGTSLGPKPDAVHDRYVGLYETFADAWRVTDVTSLFDYAPGTSTATFTLDSWPRENPTSCAIEGEPSAPSLDARVAEQHCSAIVDENSKANCIFDVMVTGHPGFAQTYALTEQLQPGATETTVKDDMDPTKDGENVTFTAAVVRTLSRDGAAPTGTVQFVVDGGNVGSPVALDSNGQAAWSTSGLQVGKHQIVAKYLPSGFGGIFLATSSPEESHTVSTTSDPLFWLVVLLIVVVIVLIVWWYRNK